MSFWFFRLWIDVDATFFLGKRVDDFSRGCGGERR